MHKVCPVCGKEFHDPKHPDKKCCCRLCASKLRIKREHKSCLYCGKSFLAKKDGNGNCSLFCSRYCYDNHRTKSRNLCLNCGTRVKGGGMNGGHKYCSHKCKVEHKKPQPRPCVNCKTIFTPIKYNTAAKRFVAHNAGKTCSAKCQNEWIRNNPDRKRKISAAFTGAKHPNWQGGKSDINILVHRGSGWVHLAERVRDRDGRVCRSCGKTEADNGRKLDVHHVVAYHDINDSKKANRMSNLISLCVSCHKKEEHKLQYQQTVLPFAVIAREERHMASGKVFASNPLYAKKTRSAESRAKMSASIKAMTRKHEIVLVWNGVEKSISQLAREHGITRDLLYKRIKEKGWPLDKALTTPSRKKTK